MNNREAKLPMTNVLKRAIAIAAEKMQQDAMAGYGYQCLMYRRTEDQVRGTGLGQSPRSNA